LPYAIISSLQGRMAENILLPNGGFLQGFVVMYPVSKHLRWIKNYQIVQEKTNEMVVYVVINENKNLPDEIHAQIISEMRGIVGDKVNVAISVVSSIPLTKRGKHLFVRSTLHRSS